jgi:RHS repeat-associated protein
MARRTKTTTLSSTTTTYTYDGEGRRIKASTGSQAAKNTIFLWDSNRPISQLVRETDGNNAVVREYQYGLDRVSMRVGSSAYFFHHDGLGSVVNVTSSTGVAQWTYQYHPYGGARTTTKNNNQAPVNLTKFAGQYLDPTGLYHMRARQYDPVTGRFTAIDPVPPVTGQPCSSTYAYARNNPIGLVDPTGRESRSAQDQRNLLDQLADLGPCDPLTAVSGVGLIVLGGFEVASGLLGIGAVPVTAGASAAGSWILITSGAATTIAGTARFMEGWNDCGVLP